MIFWGVLSLDRRVSGTEDKPLGTYSYSRIARFMTVDADGTYDITAFGAQGGYGTGEPAASARRSAANSS